MVGSSGNHRSAEDEKYVLIVDDDDSNSRFLAILARSQGYETVVVETAERGLDTIRRRPPALVLLDVRMPGMNGLEFARLLKSDPATAHIPIIVVTAHKVSETEEAAIQIGCDAYFSKPVDITALKSCLRDNLKTPD